ncbi:MAG: glycogen/starch synthase [Campylobacterota bacterium]|nr:glycogen/starch synthase [Campylobacterota bacterium]
MNILFAASEIFPYAKSGGLADVAHSLPEALRKANERVYTIMPLYNIIDRDKYKILYSGLTFDYWLGGICHQFDLFHRQDAPEDLFIYNPILCDRIGLYHDAFGEFGDNGLRFGLFSYAVLEVMIRMDLSIDVLHINDWQSALVALLAKTRYQLDTKVVLTIHNLAYQGVFDKSLMDELEVDWEECFNFEGLEYYDSVNFLKAGIFYSDYVTTVSKTYAQEIQTPLFGYGLDDVLRINHYKLTGIVNGISNEIFDPKKDKDTFKHFSTKRYKGKIDNKIVLCETLGLPDPNRALFVFIGRFTSQKGVDLLLDGLHLFKDFEANFIILGSGEEYYEHRFEALAHSFENIHIEIGYDEALSHKLYASADFLLMPSTFEPCGLNQMIAMRYGALPIVAKTGGLKDTVTDFNDVRDIESHHQGIGVSFDEHNLYWMLHAMAKALSLYGNYEKFKTISKHNMLVDNSWKHSAHEYIKLYKG